MTGQPDQPTLPETTDDTGQETARKLPSQRSQPATEATAGRPAVSEIREADRHPGDSVQEHLIARLWRLPPGHPSSPYEADGRLRPPVPDWRELGRTPPDGEKYQDAASATADESSSPESLAEYGAESQFIENQRPSGHDVADQAGGSVREVSRSWLTALPELRDLWEKHEEKWAVSARAPIDRSADEPGSWRGDNGHFLNAEENLVSDHAKTRVEEIEEKWTPALLEIKDEISGAEMAGLENRLKGIERFKEKIAEETRSKPERSIGEIAERMPDALRYTYQVESARYAEGYWHGRATLQQRGNELLMSRNSWDDPEYKGINTRWLSPQGQVFEVQFHTPESFEAKQLTHKAYERLRSRSTDPAERPGLEEYQREVSAHIPIPQGAADIPDYRREGY